MHIDSAREVKSSLLKQYLKPIVVAPAKLGALAVAARAAKQFVPSYLALRTIGARAVNKVDPIQRSISLGVARKGPNNFRLAIRIQTRALEMAPLVEAFVKRCEEEGRVADVARRHLLSRLLRITCGCAIRASGSTVSRRRADTKYLRCAR